MKLNKSDKISDDGGDWLILIDYRSEGFSVKGQYDTPEEAILNLGSDFPETIVKLPEFEFSVDGK